MRPIQRTFKITKTWISICVILIILVYFLLTTTFAPLQPSMTTTRTAEALPLTLETTTRQEFNRLTPKHEQLLNSAIAHIRLGYVANRTPHYSTPPLLVLYSHHHQLESSTLEERLVNVMNGYYFSMMNAGSAFAYDMTWPVKLEWYFLASPEYMVMNTDQAKFYKGKINAHQIEYHVDPIPNLDRYQLKKGIEILATTHWQPEGYLEMAKNPSMKAARDKYRLNHLPQKSDWFYITNRLLFSRYTDWLRSQLEPYKEIMGGKIDLSEGLSQWDPSTQKVSFHTKSWLRLGLRITAESQIQSFVQHIKEICKKTSHCHVFISAINKNLLSVTRKQLTGVAAVHAVAEGFQFKNDFVSTNDATIKELFETDQEALKNEYARLFMDWIILSRMDYLLGAENDDYLKLAAWAAQVQTDIISSHNTIHPMSDW